MLKGRPRRAILIWSIGDGHQGNALGALVALESAFAVHQFDARAPFEDSFVQFKLSISCSCLFCHFIVGLHSCRIVLPSNPRFCFFSSFYFLSSPGFPFTFLDPPLWLSSSASNTRRGLYQISQSYPKNFAFLCVDLL